MSEEMQRKSPFRNLGNEKRLMLAWERGKSAETIDKEAPPFVLKTGNMSALVNSQRVDGKIESNISCQFLIYDIPLDQWDYYRTNNCSHGKLSTNSNGGECAVVVRVSPKFYFFWKQNKKTICQNSRSMYHWPRFSNNTRLSCRHSWCNCSHWVTGNSVSSGI